MPLIRALRSDLVPVDRHVRRRNAQQRDLAPVVHVRRACRRSAFGHARHLEPTSKPSVMPSSSIRRPSLALDVDRAGAPIATRQRQPVVVDVGHDDVTGPDVRAIAAAMMPIGPAPVISTSSPTRSNDSAVCVALPNGSKIDAMSSGMSVGNLERVERGHHQVFGERALAIDADADGVAAQMAAPGAAVAAEAAGDVAFARHAVAVASRGLPGPCRRSRRRTRDRRASAPGWSFAPTRPVPDVHVGAADRRLADPIITSLWPTSGFPPEPSSGPVADRAWRGASIASP